MKDYNWHERAILQNLWVGREQMKDYNWYEDAILPITWVGREQMKDYNWYEHANRGWTGTDEGL